MSAQLPWYVARAAGIVAWALLAASVLWGLAMTTRALGPKPKRPWLLDLHRFLGGLALVFTAIHVVAIMGDSYVHFGLAEALVPLASKWHPIPVAFGIVGIYLLAAVEFTSLLRSRILEPAVAPGALPELPALRDEHRAPAHRGHRPRAAGSAHRGRGDDAGRVRARDDPHQPRCRDGSGRPARTASAGAAGRDRRDRRGAVRSGSGAIARPVRDERIGGSECRRGHAELEQQLRRGREHEHRAGDVEADEHDRDAVEVLHVSERRLRARDDEIAAHRRERTAWRTVVLQPPREHDDADEQEVDRAAVQAGGVGDRPRRAASPTGRRRGARRR